MRSKKRSAIPFWWPDAQGFVIGAVTIYVGVALFYRMVNPEEISDKLLDMMLTLLFGTAFVGVINYVIGSSRSSGLKDETNNRIIEKLTSPPPNGPVAAAVPAAPPVAVLAWWGLLTKEEQVAIDAVGSNTRVAAFLTASKAGRATPDDLAYLVSLGLLTAERAAAIQST